MLLSPDLSPCRQAGHKLTSHAKNSFLKADELAKKFNHLKVDNIHLLLAIFLERGCIGSNILKDLGIKKGDFYAILKKNPAALTGLSSAADGLKKTFIKAYGAAKDFHYPYVGTEHLTYALINSSDKTILKLISAAELQVANKSIKSLFNPSQLSNIPKIFDLPEMTISKTSSKKQSATPLIDKFCIDINQDCADKREIVIGREKEIERMINILGRKNKNNPLLIGDPGVGKTAVVSGLAHRINEAEVPSSLHHKRIMSLDVAQLIAGTGFRGEFETRLKEIIREASASKDIILFVDEIHTIVGAGNMPGGLDLANILKPALSRGEMQLIGATTFSEYKKHIEKDAALERRFQPIHIQEPTEEESKKILFGIKKSYEDFHNVTISDESIRLAVELSIRYIQNRFLPDKAIDVIDETASDIRLGNNTPQLADFIRQIRKLEDIKLSILEEKENLVDKEDYEKAISLRGEEKRVQQQIKLLQEKQSAIEKKHPSAIGAQDIIKTISKISGVPIEKISQEKSKRVKNIQKVLNAHIVGQKEAIGKLSSALLRSQSGIGNPDRPLGSFLFLGPTGVGKTLTARTLAQEFFGSSRSLIKIDMSELMERHSISSLIGSPAGYVGYGEGGRLTEKVRRNPYSAILFDEIEKAHPDVFNILLQILEDGILTDAEGTAVSFKNTIIILTSNIGTDDFTNASKVGFESGSESKKIQEKFNEIKDNALKDLEKRMHPELLNRLDHILVFNSLGEKEIKKIAEKELKKLSDRIRKQGIEVSFSRLVADFIAQKSLAAKQGARLVRKNIQEIVEQEIAEMIIYSRVKNGKITISVEGEKIKIA